MVASQFPVIPCQPQEAECVHIIVCTSILTYLGDIWVADTDAHLYFANWELRYKNDRAAYTDL